MLAHHCSRIPVCPGVGSGRVETSRDGSDSWGRAGKWLGECPTRDGSRIRGASGIGLSSLVSVEKLRGTDLCLGQIDATPRLHTRVLTWQPGC